MPELNGKKEKIIFISHVWEQTEYHETLVAWLKEAPILIENSWANCSESNISQLKDQTITSKCKALTHQIYQADLVIVMAGLYHGNTDWLEYQKTEALRMDKTHIVVDTWDKDVFVSSVISRTNRDRVKWEQESVIEAVERCFKKIALNDDDGGISRW